MVILHQTFVILELGTPLGNGVEILGGWERHTWDYTGYGGLFCIERGECIVSERGWDGPLTSKQMVWLHRTIEEPYGKRK